ncbi:unnamed protein product, partial [Allacma fusca]
DSGVIGASVLNTRNGIIAIIASEYVRSVANDDIFKCPNSRITRGLSFLPSIPGGTLRETFPPRAVQHLNVASSDAENHVQQTFSKPESSFKEDEKAKCIFPISPFSMCRGNNPPVLQPPFSDVEEELFRKLFKI